MSHKAEELVHPGKEDFCTVAELNRKLALKFFCKINEVW